MSYRERDWFVHTMYCIHLTWIYLHREYYGTWQSADRGGADLNDESLWISRAYLWISDHCGVTVQVKVIAAECCIQTAGESDKMRINHVIKTDQWHAALHIRPAPHFCRVPMMLRSLGQTGLETKMLASASTSWPQQVGIILGLKHLASAWPRVC